MSLQGSNEIIITISPKIHKNTWQYNNVTTDGNTPFQILEVVPVRVKVPMLGEMKIPMNRVCFDAHTNEINPQLTNKTRCGLKISNN